MSFPKLDQPKSFNGPRQAMFRHRASPFPFPFQILAYHFVTRTQRNTTTDKTSCTFTITSCTFHYIMKNSFKNVIRILEYAFHNTIENKGSKQQPQWHYAMNKNDSV